MQRQLRDWLATFQQFVGANSESPDSYIRWAGISCIAGALQRRVWMRWGHTVVYPNMYVILVGPSGKARKGEPIMIARSMIEEINVPLIAEDNSQEAVIQDLRMALQHFDNPLTGGPSFQCAASAFSEEASVFLGAQNTTFLAYLTQWYDSREKWKRRTKHQGTDEITGVCFNMLLATAPDWIPHIFPREAIGGGFTSRCLFIVEHEKGKTITNPNLRPPNQEMRSRLMHDLERISTLAGEYVFDPEALEAYEKWYQEEDKRLAKGNPPIADPAFAGYCSRRATHVKKIAICLAASQGEERVITLPIFQQALADLLAVEAKMSNVFESVGDSRYAKETELLLKYIADKGTVKRSVLLQDLHRHIDTYVLDQVTAVLEGMKAIRRERLEGERDWLYISSEGQTLH